MWVQTSGRGGGGTITLMLCSRQPCLVWVHPYSLWMGTVLGEWGGLLSSPDNLLHSSKIRLCSWAEPGCCRSAEDRFNDCRVELYQQLLWQVELPQLAKAYWAFLKIESMWNSHFRSWEMVLPRNLNDSTVVTVLFMMVSGGNAGGSSWSPR